MMQKRIDKIEEFCKNPIQSQENVFDFLISKGKDTAFGKSHQFSAITNYSNFSKKIPIRTYEEFSVFIDRARDGEQNVLWPGKIKWFAKSSGTTNAKSKYIPITEESLEDCHFKGGKDMLSLYGNNFPFSDMYNGKGLMLGGTIKNSENGSYKDGDLSAILLDEFPFWVNYHRIPDIETALMSRWEEKLERIAQQSLTANITNLTGVPSWMLILLKRVLTISGKDNISEVWPNLELYMHGGVNFEPYREQFKTLIPSKKMNYLEGYNASEGFIGIQDKNPSEGLLLMLDYGIFYEFIPMRDYKKGILKAIPLQEVKLNIDYALVISTNGGLWRYLIGDVIRFTSLAPFRIQIIGRTKSFLNAFGEELIVENTDKALLAACSICTASIKDYTVAPIFIDNDSGGHQWFIEFSKEPENIDLFTQELDKSLQSLNSDYAAKRSNNLILSSPEIIVIQNNEFYTWLKQNNRIGGQYKIPRLSNNRKIADEILTLL
ncbi:MAG: GH3 auxin-responsive promoter family protein [Flavobacteriales bacterium]|nr:GH3 auxin-responsive promoter family protein [Flavobacteriales bacterium]